MLNWSSALSRSASRWTLQISTSIGASLIAALIVQALPRSMPDVPMPAPELTSGGKFAARVEATRAYDGLDTMPLPHVDGPHVATAFVVPAAFVAAPTDLAGLGAALRQPGADGAGAAHERVKPSRLARAPSRAEALRLGPPADAPLPPAEPDDATPPEAASADPADVGLLHQVASRTRQMWSTTSATTRDVWSTTASVGSSLVSRLVP